MSVRERFAIGWRRCCGAAARIAMEQLPSVEDRSLREAFSSWERYDEGEAAALRMRFGREPAWAGRTLSGADAGLADRVMQ